MIYVEARQTILCDIVRGGEGGTHLSFLPVCVHAGQCQPLPQQSAAQAVLRQVLRDQTQSGPHGVPHLYHNTTKQIAIQTQTSEKEQLQIHLRLYEQTHVDCAQQITCTAL